MTGDSAIYARSDRTAAREVPKSAEESFCRYFKPVRIDICTREIYCCRYLVRDFPGRRQTHIRAPRSQIPPTYLFVCTNRDNEQDMDKQKQKRGNGRNRLFRLHMVGVELAGYSTHGRSRTPHVEVADLRSSYAPCRREDYRTAAGGGSATEGPSAGDLCCSGARVRVHACVYVCVVRRRCRAKDTPVQQHTPSM